MQTNAASKEVTFKLKLAISTSYFNKSAITYNVHYTCYQAIYKIIVNYMIITYKPVATGRYMESDTCESTESLLSVQPQSHSCTGPQFT